MKRERLNPDAYFLILLSILMLIVITISLRMEYVSSKALPLIFAFVILLLSLIQLGKELDIRKQKPVGANKVSGEAAKVEGERPRYAIVVGWLFGFILAIYFLGFLIAMPLFIISYMKYNRARWSASIIVAILTAAPIYILFELILHVDLYPGILFLAFE